MRKYLYPLFIFIIITTNGCTQKSTVHYDDNAAAGKYVSIRGVKIYCEIYGEGKPLLMIHGNNGNLAAFKDNIPYFSKKYKVIAVDSRSQGRSVDAKDSLSFEMMADDFAVLLDSLHIKSAYVLGWSDGGINALLLAIRHPEKVIKLASTGANLWPDSTAFTKEEWESEKSDYQKWQHQKISSPQEKNDYKMFKLDWDQPHIALADLHKIKCPSLIICGDHDLISVEHTKLIYRNIPNAAFWLVANSSHSTLQDHAEEFNKRVNAFFSEPFRHQ